MRFYYRHLTGLIKAAPVNGTNTFMKFFLKKKKIISNVFIILCILISPIPSIAMDFSFEWEANPEPVTGYKLYYKVGENSERPYEGTELNEGASPITVGKVTTYTVTGLSPDKTYHFALTAYNDDGESGYSSVVTVSPDSIPDPVPVINNISIN